MRQGRSTRAIGKCGSKGHYSLKPTPKSEPLRTPPKKSGKKTSFAEVPIGEKNAGGGLYCCSGGGPLPGGKGPLVSEFFSIRGSVGFNLLCPGRAGTLFRLASTRTCQPRKNNTK